MHDKCIGLLLLLFGSRIRLIIVGQPCQIVHAGVQGDGDFSALLKGVVSFSVFDFGIIALVDACEHLHFYLCISTLFAELFQSVVHVITQLHYGKLTY